MVLELPWKVNNMLHIYRGEKVALQISSVTNKHANTALFNRLIACLDFSSQSKIYHCDQKN